MKFSAHNLKRYKDIALLLTKYGSSASIPSPFDLNGGSRRDDPQERAQAHELPNDLERLGPTFVKLGQILSSRPDILPEPYVEALSRLQDRVKPFPYDDVEAIVEAELGARINKIFGDFSREPLAAASLGQVHSASMHDGRPVVVKVQRPGILKQIEGDFAALAEMAGFLNRHTRLGQKYQIQNLLEEFQTTLANELDYRREAANMTAIRHNLRKFSRIIVPEPIHDYSTSKLLTMTFIEGKKITALSPLGRIELDGGGLAEELFQAYLQQILIDGVFHADPHPGNILLTNDHRIALLDLGMVGRTSPAMQENLLKLLLAVSEGESDDATEVALQMGRRGPDFDESAFRHRTSQLVCEYKNNTLAEMDVGKILLSVTRAAADADLYVPMELSVLGKTLLQLDHIGRVLDPHFEPSESVRRNASSILNQRLKGAFTEGKMYATLLEAKQFVGTLPTRLNKILDAVGKAELNVNVRPAETEFLIESARRVANRITTGLVLAALIVGAALLMRVQTPFTLFGYPGLAIICFLLAAFGGFVLLLNIFWQDHRMKNKARRP